MSNIYILEPPTHGKVCINSSVGDIDIELWSKEAPKACRNFVQLCLEGYYHGTIFHRAVKEFIVQGGDPTGTGHGGESIYGKPFKDEFHSRLKFVRRGLVAMANAGANDNGSQFFFTLGPAKELDKKHTIFGKVSGHTVYNMLKLGDLDVDSNERPLCPPKIFKTKVLFNPFDDITPRVLETKKDGDKPKKRKHTSKATKNFKLLSFGEEAEEDEEEVNKVSKNMKHKSKSSHDLLDDEKLSSVPVLGDGESLPGDSALKRAASEEDSDTDSDSRVEKKAETAATLERIKKKLKKDDDDGGTATTATAATTDRLKQRGDSDAGEGGAKKELSKIEELRKEAKQLKRELQGNKKEKDKEPSTEEKAPPVAQNSVIAAYEEERRKYEDRKMGRKKSSREQETLAILSKFQTKLSAARTLGQYSEDEDEDKPEDKPSEEEEEDPNDLTWMNHRLNFEESQKRVLDANVADSERYEIFDPRNPLTKRRREASKQSRKDKERR